MWEIAAMVELLEQKGLCTKRNLLTIVDHAQIPETAIPLAKRQPMESPLAKIITDVEEATSKAMTCTRTLISQLKGSSGSMTTVQDVNTGGR